MANDRENAAAANVKNLWSQVFSALGAKAASRETYQRLQELPADQRADFIMKTWGQIGLDRTAAIIQRITTVEREIS